MGGQFTNGISELTLIIVMIKKKLFNKAFESSEK